LKKNHKENFKTTVPSSCESHEIKNKLPKNFADELLFCELELEKDEIDLKFLNKLLELYTVKPP